MSMTAVQQETVEALVAERTADLRAAYEASEARFRALIETSADVTAITRPDGTLQYVSPSITGLLGYEVEDLLDRVGFAFIHPEDEPVLRRAFERALVTAENIRTEPFRAMHKHGGWLLMEATGLNLLGDPAVNGIVFTVRDITAQHELEFRLRQAERLEAVGQLAGGIAHDFNNVLLVIRGYSSVLRSSIEDPALVGDLDEIAKAADRAAALTRQLLAFSRRQVMQPTLLDLGEVAADLESLLLRSIREDIDMTLEVRGDLPPVLADAGQMEQVLLNLVVNARDAMPDGGSIQVSVARAELGRTSNVSPPLPPGSYVALSVSDTGSGIPPEALPRIFEPFFTTKADGLGTGLGLSTVYGIVVQSGGGIEVASLPAGGTRMTVFLPAAEGVADGIDDDLLAVEALAAGNERILLVEDEDPVRELVRRVLEDAGYEVLAAARPSEAQRLAAEHEVDLLLTDVVMPEMSGYDLATRVHLAHPGIRTLFISGYAHRALDEATEHPEGELLRKPFSPEQLTTAVRAVLDGDGVK
jgi:PAS domain S-box-containing protein